MLHCFGTRSGLAIMLLTRCWKRRRGVGIGYVDVWPRERKQVMPKSTTCGSRLQSAPTTKASLKAIARTMYLVINSSLFGRMNVSLKAYVIHRLLDHFVVLQCSPGRHSVSVHVVSSSRSSEDPKETECALFHQFESRQGEVKWPPPPLVGLQVECEVMLSEATRQLIERLGEVAFGRLQCCLGVAIFRLLMRVGVETGGRRDPVPPRPPSTRNPTRFHALSTPPFVPWKRQVNVKLHLAFCPSLVFATHHDAVLFEAR